jgi:hypothetical protein
MGLLKVDLTVESFAAKAVSQSNMAATIATGYAIRDIPLDHASPT